MKLPPGRKTLESFKKNTGADGTGDSLSEISGSRIREATRRF